jgi:hypothetical protein
MKTSVISGDFQEFCGACVVAQPAGKVPGAVPNRSFVSVGVVDNQAFVIEAALHRRGMIISDPIAISDQFARNPPERSLDGVWFFGGILLSHFGHFLSESVHRLRPFLESNTSFDGVVFIDSPMFAPNAIDKTYVKSILTEYFAVPLEKIHVVKRNTLVERLVIAPQESAIGLAPSDSYMEYLQCLESRFLASPCLDYFPSPKKIFLSRKNYLNKGRLLGLDAVEEVLQRAGYEVLLPETMPVRQQIHLAASAEHVIAEEGSALHIFDILGPRSSSLSILCRRKLAAQRWRKQFSNQFQSLKVFEDIVGLGPFMDQCIPADEPALPDIGMFFSFLRSLGIHEDRNTFISSVRDSIISDMRKLSLSL